MEHLNWTLVATGLFNGHVTLYWSASKCQFTSEWVFIAQIKKCVGRVVLIGFILFQSKNFLLILFRSFVMAACFVEN